MELLHFHPSIYRLFDSLVVECWLRAREVPGSILSQEPRHTRRYKNGTRYVQVVPVLLAVRWDTFYRFIAHAIRCLHCLKDCFYKLLIIFMSISITILYAIVSEFDCTLLYIVYCFDVVVVVVVQRTKRKTGFLAKYVILLK